MDIMQIAREVLEETKANTEGARAKYEALKKEQEDKHYVAEFTKQAEDMGINHVGTALKLADRDAFKMDDSGKFIDFPSQMNALMTQNPFLVRRDDYNSPENQRAMQERNDRSRALPSHSDDVALQEAHTKAKTTGTVKDRVAYASLKQDHRIRREGGESETLAQIRAEREEAAAKVKAEAERIERIERDQPFNDEVAARLAEYQTKKTTKRG